MSLIVRIYKKLPHFTLDVDFACEDHFICLLGASGSGKSMTLKCIAGLEKPDRGYIALNGRVLFDDEKKIDLSPQERKVGYLFQNYALFNNMTVAENILISLYKNRNQEEKNRKLKEMVHLMRLEGQEKKYPFQLSGGQQQRTALARILMSSPELLLLDEPFAALDSHLREKLQMEMKELLNSYSRQVIMVTHDRDEAYRMADGTGVLDNGHLLVFKKTKELYRNPEYVSAARLIGCKNIVRVKPLSTYELTVEEWGITIHMEKEIPMDITHIGIKAHHFGKDKQLMYPITYHGGLEDTFEYIVRFRFLNQKSDSSDIWWKIPSANMETELPEFIGFNEQDVLLLKEEGSEC